MNTMQRIKENERRINKFKSIKKERENEVTFKAGHVNFYQLLN